MADKSGSGWFGADDGGSIDMRPLLRLGAWGGCAVIALAAAVYAGRSEIGERRASVALASIGKASAEQTASPATEKLIARAIAAESEAKRLSETVRQLAADREQLAGRIASLERNLDDLTGSIAKGPSAARDGSLGAATPAPAASAPATTPATDAPARPETTGAVAPSGPAASEPAAEAARPSVPLPRPAPLALIQSYVSPATTAGQPAAPEAARGEFAVDLGGGASVEALRTQWNQLKARHGALLDGLQPLVAVRSPRPGTTVRRLIVGPLANPTAVARVCAALSAAGTTCTPAVYDGQRLALR